MLADVIKICIYCDITYIVTSLQPHIVSLMFRKLIYLNILDIIKHWSWFNKMFSQFFLFNPGLHKQKHWSVDWRIVTPLVWCLRMNCRDYFCFILKYFSPRLLLASTVQSRHPEDCTEPVRGASHDWLHASLPHHPPLHWPGSPHPVGCQRWTHQALFITVPHYSQ